MLRDGALYLCDGYAANVEFPELEETCQELQLNWGRGSEGTAGYDASLADWRPGMPKPLWRCGSNEHPDETLNLDCEPRPILKQLESRRIALAVQSLQSLLPDIPQFRPFEIV